MTRRPGTAWSRGVSLLTLGTVGLVLGACSAGPLEVDDPPRPDADAARACEQLVEALPETVDDLERRDVDGGDGLVAAWGDPAIVLTCGVPPPEGFTDDATCIEANGTGWWVPDEVLLADDETLDVTMTAVGFRPRVEVFVPGDLRPDGFADAAAKLGLVVSENLELVEPCQ